MTKGIILAVGALLLAGCATHRIPTPYGDMVFISSLWGREIPVGTYTITTVSSNGVITNLDIRIEGYKSWPDKDAIKATGAAGGDFVGTAGGTAAKIFIK
jgi:hypothetical protein